MIRAIFALIFLLSVPTLITAQQRLPLADISAYLNSFQTAEAKFVQINSDDTLSSGMLYIKRPGRLRIEYDSPDRMLVVAGGGAVVVFDPKSNSGPQTFPLRRTPLSIILARTVDLENADMVTHHEFDGKSTIVTAQDPQNPQYGNLRIVFSFDPIEISEWVVTDGSGEQTSVYLQQFQTGKSYSDLLFDSSLIDNATGR